MELEVTIITGMSGAGRSEAANVLEDLGYFVIDNLPPALISRVADLARGGGHPKRYGLVVDVRSGEFMESLEEATRALQSEGAEVQVLFFDANDEVLVRRFNDTRRKHPLQQADSVLDGIHRERELLADLRERADLVIDTSDLNVHELRDRIQATFTGSPEDGGLHTSVVSFGYKHGLPLDVDLVFDCRFLPNPHWIEKLRPLTGSDPAVRDYVLSQPETQQFLQELENFFALTLPLFEREGKAYLTVGIGCTGGRHRSVVIADEVAHILEKHGQKPTVTHRDVNHA